MILKFVVFLITARLQTPEVTSLIKVPQKGIDGDVCGAMKGKKFYLGPDTEANIYARNVSHPFELTAINKILTNSDSERSPERPRFKAKYPAKFLNSSQPSQLLKRLLETNKRKRETKILVQKIEGVENISSLKQREKAFLNLFTMTNIPEAAATTKVGLGSHGSDINNLRRSANGSHPTSVVYQKDELNSNRVFEDGFPPNFLNRFEAFSDNVETTSIVTHERNSKENIPNASNHQRPFLKCFVKFFTCHDCHLEFDTIAMNLPPCVSNTSACQCDYISMQEPPFTSDGRQNACNSDGMTTYISKTRQVTFSFLYKTSYQLAFDISVTAKKNVFRIDNSAGRSSGTIGTPFFPKLYPNDFWSEYIFHSNNPKHRIKVAFDDFSISPWSFIDVEDTNKSRVATFYGTIFRPPVLVSSGANLIVRFVANGVTKKGFKMQYEFVNAGSVESFPPVTDCGGLVTGDGGVITMMKMVTGNTTVLYDCIWLIQAHPDSSLKSFLSLKVIQFQNMGYPYNSKTGASSELEIRQGLTSQENLLEKMLENNWMVKEHIVTKGFYIRLRAAFKSGSILTIVYSSFSYLDNCHRSTNFVCRNGRCISKLLRCDAYDHCGDNSDEPSSCFNGKINQEAIVNTLEESSWHKGSPNYFFNHKNYIYGPSLTSGMLLLFAVFMLMLMIIGLLFYVFRPSVRTSSQRSASIRVHDPFNNESVEVFDVSDDDPPTYEPPPDYEDVVKMILSGNDLKLVRRPGGITAWVSDTPTEEAIERPSMDNLNSLASNSLGNSGVVLNASQNGKTILRTRHSSFDDEDYIGTVIWSSKENFLKSLPNSNEVKGNRKTSLPSPPCFPKHPRPSLAISTAEASKCLPTHDTEPEDLDNPDAVRMKIEAHEKSMIDISSSRRQHPTEDIAGTSSAGIIWSKNSTSPPSYESVLRQMSKKAGTFSRVALKSYHSKGVKSSHIRRSVRMRQSTLLRVRTARAKFQTLAMGGELSSDNSELSKKNEGLNSYPSYACDRILEKMIAKEIVKNKKEILLRKEIKHCDCKFTCRCSAFQKLTEIKMCESTLVFHGNVRSKIQYYHSVNSGYPINEQHCLHDEANDDGKTFLNKSKGNTFNPFTTLEPFQNNSFSLDRFPEELKVFKISSSVDKIKKDTCLANQKAGKIIRRSSYP